jgi:hypothetical protein
MWALHHTDKTTRRQDDKDDKDDQSQTQTQPPETTTNPLNQAPPGAPMSKPIKWYYHRKS